MTPSGRPSTDALLRRGVAGDGGERWLTLEPRFQGLPDTAHGGTVLAVFDAVAGADGARTISGAYRRRVPLGTPLRLVLPRRAGTARVEVFDGTTVLVGGGV